MLLLQLWCIHSMNDRHSCIMSPVGNLGIRIKLLKKYTLLCQLAVNKARPWDWRVSCCVIGILQLSVPSVQALTQGKKALYKVLDLVMMNSASSLWRAERQSLAIPSLGIPSTQGETWPTAPLDICWASKQIFHLLKYLLKASFECGLLALFFDLEWHFCIFTRGLHLESNQPQKIAFCESKNSQACCFNETGSDISLNGFFKSRHKSTPLHWLQKYWCN